MGSGSGVNLQDILSLFSGQAQAAAANGGTVPPMPERNPAFHTLPGDPVASPGGSASSARGGLFGGSVPPLPERNPIFRPEEGETPVQGGLLGGSGPGQTVVKTPLRDGNSAWRDKGYTVESVPATATTSGSAPSKSQPDLVKQVANNAPATAPAGSQRASLLGDGAQSGAPEPSSTAPVQATTNETTPATSAPKGLFASKMFMPDDGSFFGGLQGKLQNSGTNPLVQIGLGLLASGYDGTNPYPLIMKGLTGIQNQQIAGVGSDTSAEKLRLEAAQRAAEQQAMLRILSEYKKPAEDTGVAAMRTKIVK